jgi:hypothetical protein
MVRNGDRTSVQWGERRHNTGFWEAITWYTRIFYTPHQASEIHCEFYVIENFADECMFTFIKMSGLGGG